jgi:predicted nicotinamide N-methyase
MFAAHVCGETNLDRVGEQVWAAELLLCEYVLSGFMPPANGVATVLELGAGVAVCALVTAGVGGVRAVYATGAPRVRSSMATA